MAERGFPDLNMNGWQGVWVSSGTPEAMANRIHSEIVKAFAAPKIKEVLGSSGYEFSPVISLAEQKKALKDQFDRYAAIVKELNIKAD